MRVIAGKAKRYNLMAPKGLDVRPTTDRIKETLFNMLQDEVTGCRFLDLFAGSGGIGIEALSRGADSCVFVDHDRQSVGCIRANLEHTKLQEQARVIQGDYRTALSRLRKSDPFDIIFLDPPYGKDLETDALRLITKYNLLADEGVVIIESLLDSDYTGKVPEPLVVTREKIYKTNKHVFIRKEFPCI